MNLLKPALNFSASVRENCKKVPRLRLYYLHNNKISK